jgi:hypothetical protein
MIYKGLLLDFTSATIHVKTSLFKIVASVADYRVTISSRMLTLSFTKGAY